MSSLFSMSLAIAKTIAPVTSSGETRNNAPLCMRGLKLTSATAMWTSLIWHGDRNVVRAIWSIAVARSGTPGVALHCKSIQNRLMPAV